MALSFEDIQSQLAQPEPSFYTYGKIPSTKVPEQPVMSPLSQMAPSQPSPLQMAQGGAAIKEERNVVTPMPGRKPEAAPTGSRVVPPEGYPPGTLGSAYEPGSQLPPGVDPMASIPNIGDPREAAKMMALFSLLPKDAFGNMGSVADPNIAASARKITDTRPAGGLQGQQFEEGYLETQRTSPLLGIWQSGLADVLAENPEAQARVDELEAERSAGLEQIEKSFSDLKPLSDLLKGGKFKEAFQYAESKGLTDHLMDTKKLKDLRGPFSQEEMAAFFNAIPPEVAKRHTGEGWTFDPSRGVAGSLDPLGTGGKGTMESGFPDVDRAFERKDNKLVENLVKIAGAAMLATAVPGLAGAAGGTGGGAGALTGVVPTGLVPGTAAATAATAAPAVAAGLQTFPIIASAGGTGIGSGLAALGAGAAGASAVSGGSAASPTQPSPTPTGQELEEVVVQSLRKAPPPDLATALASTSAGQGVQDILSERQIQEAQEAEQAATEEQQPPAEEDVIETFRIPGTLPQLNVAEVIPGLASQLAQAGYRAPSIEGQPPPSEETLDAMEEVVVRGQPPVTPIDLTAPLVGGLTAAQIAQGFTQPNVDPTTGELREPLESQQELDKIQDALAKGTTIPGAESLWDKLKGATDKLSTLQKLAALLGGLGGGLSGRDQAPVTGGLPARPSQRLPKYEYQRVQTRPDIDYFTYGTRPEALFFEDTMRRVDEPEEGPQTGLAPPNPEEGGVFARGGLAAGGRYYEGKGSGRDDKIPALLSDGEYVMDAETLALLGDGSTKEGAKRMDQFRAKIRKHKGSALSRGRISPNAKSPDKYMGGGLSR